MNTRIVQAWRDAWRPPRKMIPSQWAEARFVLPSEGNSEPGKFRFSRTPYLRGIVDCFVEPGVQEIVFVKPTRIGGTTVRLINTGYRIDVDPGPQITVQPSEAACEKDIKTKIRPLLEGCKSLRAHMSPRASDNTLPLIKLDTMPLYSGWAGSPQSLAADTCRYADCDEVDKFPPFAGREADPISLVFERTGTYLHRRRHYITSTPTTRDGAIMKEFERCGDKRYFLVPCPHCRQYQRLVFPQLKWPELPEGVNHIKHADAIEQQQLAYYECERCKGKITETHKQKMLERGVWASEGQTVRDYDEPMPISNHGTVASFKELTSRTMEDRLIGPRPKAKRVGFHISGLYSPWRNFSEIAAEFIRAKDDPAKTMNFRNSRLAEPFEIQVGKIEANIIREKAKMSPGPRIVPKWAVWLFATADTQKDYFVYTIRAWGYENRSQLIHHGIVSTFEELKKSTIDGAFVREQGDQVQPCWLLIDSGGGKNVDTASTRTAEVYEFAAADPARIKPIKGASVRQNFPIQKSFQKEKSIVLWVLDTFALKNTLDRLINDPDATKWLPHKEVDDNYCAQVAAEHLIVDPQSKELDWVTKTSGAPNHYFDCEVYQCAAAHEVGAFAVAPAEPEPTPEPQQQATQADRPDWMGERPKSWN